jgi:hypothetical protein
VRESRGEREGREREREGREGDRSEGKGRGGRERCEYEVISVDITICIER